MKDSVQPKIEKEFRLPAKPLKPNPYFLDIMKKDLTKKKESLKDESNLFNLYDMHVKSISSIFSDCPREHQFWLHGGKSLKNLKELYDELRVMSDNVFYHHVSKDKNDFASWVRHVFKDEKLALALQYALTRDESLTAIEKRAEELIKESEHVDAAVFEDAIKKMKEKNSKLEEEIRKKKEWLMQRHKEIEEREKKAIEREKELHERYIALERQEKAIKAQMRHEQERISEMRTEEQKVSMQQRDEENLEEMYKRLDSLIEETNMHLKEGSIFMAKQLIPEIRKLYMQLEKGNPKKREFWYKIAELKRLGDEAVQKAQKTTNFA